MVGADLQSARNLHQKANICSSFAVCLNFLIKPLNCLFLLVNFTGKKIIPRVFFGDDVLMKSNVHRGTYKFTLLEQSKLVKIQEIVKEQFVARELAKS